MEIISRKEAKAHGLKRYFTGKSCPHGHIVERFTSGGNCALCLAAHKKNVRAADPEKAREQDRRQQERNPGRKLELARIRRKLNPEKARENYRAWKKRNPDKAKAIFVDWAKRNSAKRCATQAKRRARLLAQRCKCCTDAQLLHFYEVASLVSREVDHKKPLGLGGLHCCANLQILTVEAHREKTVKDLRLIKSRK